VDIEITGGEQIAALAKAIKAEGAAGKGLQKTVRASIRTSAKPLGKFVAVSAGRSLPRRGGLGYKVAGAAVTVQGRLGRKGFDIIAKLKLRAKGFDLPAMDRGRLRHPVFGNRRIPWETQIIKPKVFTDPFMEGAPAIRQEIEKGLVEVAARIEKG
jgi:hypothetical protein